MASSLPLRLLLEEVVQNRPVIFEIIVRHGESTRRANLVHVDNDDAARAWDGLDLLRLDEFIERRRVKFEHAASAEEPHDARRALEGV